jgi:hypothetical protein
MITVGVCLYFYTSSVVHITFADIHGSVIIVVIVAAAAVVVNLV